VLSSKLRRHAEQLLRFGRVSVVCTVVSAAALAVLIDGLGVDVALANFVVVTVMIIPSFLLTRRWVWPHRGVDADMHRVVVFGAASLAAVVASTVAVRQVAKLTERWSPLGRTGAAIGTDLAVFGALWLLQYAFNDALVFRNDTAPADESGVR
jgi:putative flippase GtrA